MARPSVAVVIGNTIDLATVLLGSAVALGGTGRFGHVFDSARGGTTVIAPLVGKEV